MNQFDSSGYPIIDEEKGIYPLTLLLDNDMRDGTFRLSVPSIDSDSEEYEPVTIGQPQMEFA